MHQNRIPAPRHPQPFINGLPEEQRLCKSALEKEGKDIYEASGDPESAEFRAAEDKVLAIANPLTSTRRASLATESKHGTMKYYLLRRERFSIYMQYVDLQVELVHERSRRVREQIELMWQTQGMGLFDAGAKATGGR